MINNRLLLIMIRKKTTTTKNIIIQKNETPIKSILLSQFSICGSDRSHITIIAKLLLNKLRTGEFMCRFIDTNL